MATGKQPPKITLEPAGKPLRVEFGGETLVETDGALILCVKEAFRRCFMCQKRMYVGI